mgnify:CR=1 FL=1
MLTEPEERMLAEREPAAVSAWQSLFGRVTSTLEVEFDAARGDITLTFFEYNLLAALHVFRAQGVDYHVLEVGLGGRLDAVNIVDADAAIVTSI